MRAAFLDEFGGPFEIREVEDPEPGANELLLAVDACGICGTDLHIRSGSSYKPSLPFVLGHEPAGTVVAVGPGADANWLGKRVCPTIFVGCGSCRHCSMGLERLCQSDLSVIGVSGRHGGFAELLTIPQSHAIAIPADVKSREAAALVDAGSTAFGAIQAVDNDADIKRPLIAGGGPIGWLIAHLLKLVLDLEPLVVEPNAPRRQALLNSGIESTSDIAAVQETVELAIDCTGVAGVTPQLLDVLSPRGQLILVGYRAEPEISAATVSRKELKLRGVRSGGPSDLANILEVVRAGRVPLPKLEVWPLDDIESAFVALSATEVTGKAMIELGQ